MFLSRRYTSSLLLTSFFFRQTINDIQNRHEMFLSLEKSITELHDMFLDIAQLIESQGEMVNRIGMLLLQLIIMVDILY